ncbi:MULTISPECIES: peptidase inhibitor family I36 protein [Streptomyces]|uniref:peptidase inhibitor family I36 protein n=1 Tax=Streptomyces TaxID=1883 RepID=UPI000AF43E3B|nr:MULTISPECIES: peptidase inhibitor family I36 protein [Streptomyces]
MKSKLAKIVAPALSAIAIAVAGTGPASASDAEAMAYTCKDNEVCFYQHSNYTGSVFVPDELKYHSVVSDFGVKKFVNGANADNAVSSVINTTGWRFCFYDRPFMQHYQGTLGADDGANFVGQQWAYLNDRISSVQPCS